MGKDSEAPAVWRERQQPTSRFWLKTEDAEQSKLQSSRIGVTANQVNVYSLVSQWPLWKERLLFYFGFGGQLSLTVASAVGISRVIRNRFYLSGTVAALGSSYVTTSVATLGVCATHDYWVVHGLFGNRPPCVPCLQVKQALANVGLAVILPALIVIPDCLFHAARDPRYPTAVPEFWQPKRIFQFVVEKYRGPILRKLGWLSLAHVVMTSVGVAMESKAAVRISLGIDDDPNILTEYIRKGTESRSSRIRDWLISWRNN